ncbi:MAG: hypothetical protein QXX56_00850 [Candidatus Bathyarchaeia archaeon]
MGRIQAEINTPFGKVVIEGSTPKDLLEVVENLPKNFFSNLESLISEKITACSKTGHEKSNNNLVKYADEGPVLVLKNSNSITHYEAIGLLLYFSRDKYCRPSQIRRLLEYSGISAQVSSRLNEMLRKGLVFKPSPKEPEWALTPKGERWIEEEVLPRIRKMRE